MIQPLNTLKTWFQTLDKPESYQFWDWLDSFWHKSVPIPMSAIDGLDAAINGAGGDSRITVTPITIAGTGTVTVALDSSLDDVLVIPSVSGNILIGTTPGGSELLSYPVTSGQTELINLGRYFAAQTTIYFTGTFTGKVKTTSYA